MVDATNDYALLKQPDGDFLTRLLVSLRCRPIQAIALVLLFAFINLAYAAEDTVRGSTAATMPHPELSPYGIQKGSFVFRPDATYSVSYDDNTFGTKTEKVSSYVSEFTPSLAVSSTWNNHALNFNASSSFGKNHEFSSEDYSDWSLGTDGKLDISSDIKLIAGVGFDHEHLDRTATDDSRGVEPTEFDRIRYFTSYRQKFGRIVGLVNLNVVEKEYDDVEAIRFGIPVTLDNSVRDRTEYTLSLRAGYQYVGNEQVFVSIKGFERDYDEVKAFSGLDNSSRGLETSVGASFDHHGFFLGEISVGYRSQDYKDPLPDIDTPIAEANVHWNITDLTTAKFGVDHSIRESIDQFFSGYTSTTTSLGLDHELQRNLLLNLSFQYTRDKYEGIDPADRDDKTYSFVAGSTYKMNRNLFFTANYNYVERKSDLNTTLIDSSRFDFRKNLISFQIQAQF